MTFEHFKNSLDDKTPPPMNPRLLALWFDGTGEWNKAHSIAQDIPGPEGAWIHAYLHRKEGDMANAGYWYDRAGKKMPAYETEREWAELAVNFIGLENNKSNKT
jgi:hypothetical protein